MRVVALRRNAGKPDEGGDVDLVLGPYEGAIQPAHKRALLEQSDVAVCSLTRPLTLTLTLTLPLPPYP